MELLSLKLLIFSPLLVPLFFLMPILNGHEVFVRRFAKVFAVIHLIYTVCFWIFYDGNTKIETLDFFGKSWISTLGVDAAFSLDSLSLLMVVLTSFLTVMATIASKSHIRYKHKLYYSLLFLLETSILGVFTSADVFTFFFFWELELIPMYFLISLWGSGNAQKSAMKFLLYTFLASMFMLIGLLLLVYFNNSSTAQLSTLITSINISDKLPIQIQVLISILLLIGFAVKLPIIPLHTWLPNAHVDAITPVSMLLAGVLLKMGAYGIIRFNVMVLPDAFKLIAPVLIIFAVINIIFAGFVAYNQNDIKKIVAYSSISNMGIVLLGICTLNVYGMIGGIFHAISHGMISASLFMIVGIIYLRTKTRDITKLGGIASLMPNLAFFSVITSFASIGVPLFMGFVGEFLTFWGAFNSSFEDKIFIPILALTAVFVLILSACYMFKFVHKTFFGNILDNLKNLQDISVHEFIVLISITFVIVFLGMHPSTLIDFIQFFAVNVIESVGI